MALDYLPIQGSSVPCERAFSDAGLTDTKQHARLLPENFGPIQVMKNKFKKDRWRREGLTAAKEAERRQYLFNNAECEVTSRLVL